jgi:hypothetical protein
MSILNDYTQFAGRHWDTGTIHNVLAYQGVRAPHTGEPFSEALLLGVSGGIAVLYFVFEYQGFEPRVTIGTRYPFEPMRQIWERLPLQAQVYETTSPKKAVKQLTAALEGGHPAIVWADMCSLPYNTNMPYDEQFWMMMPLVVYGYDEAGDRALLADRVGVPLQVTAGELAQARNRTQKNRHKLVTLDPPQEPAWDVVAAAAREGIRTCASLYLDAPPKGPKDNFGLAALQKWAALLVDAKAVKGWPRMFLPGAALFAGMTTAYGSIEGWETGGSAARGLYAAFLDEAAVLLEQPGLANSAQQFRASAAQWSDLARALLPDHVLAFQETRTLLSQRDQLFGTKGAAALAEMAEIDARLARIKEAVTAEFPLSAAEVAALREEWRERVLAIHDQERAAVLALRQEL